MTIHGSVKTLPKISGRIKKTALGGQISDAVIKIGDGKPYEGDYVITPEFSDQILKTKNRSLLEDMRFEAIPVARTSNIAGGNTVIIGG